MFEAGLLSSKYPVFWCFCYHYVIHGFLGLQISRKDVHGPIPLPCFSVSRPTRTEQPLLATPCRKHLIGSAYQQIYISRRVFQQQGVVGNMSVPMKTDQCLQFRGGQLAFSRFLLHRHLYAPCVEVIGSEWPS